MSSTLVPDFPSFPFLAPARPHYHSIPIAKKRRRTRLTEHRNLFHETNDLSEEEEDVDELFRHVKDRGQNFYIPLGRTTTAQEERADANLDSPSETDASAGAASDVEPRADSNEEGSEMSDEEGDDDDNEDDEEMDDDDEVDEEDEDEEHDLDAGMVVLDEDDSADLGPSSSRYNDSTDYEQAPQFSADPRNMPNNSQW